MGGTRKILILGNGFDLAHFLPTKYDHFMHAMRNVEKYNTDEPMCFENLYTDLLSSESYFFDNTIKLYKTEEATLPLEEVKELQDDLKKNGWFQYFKSYIDSGIDTWIDFENEMEVVLNAVCYIISEIEKDIKNLDYFSDNIFLSNKMFDKDVKRKYPFINNLLEKFSIIDKHSIHAETKIVFDKNFIKYYSGQPIDICASSLLKHLEEDLMGFIEIFSQYITFINELEVKDALKKPEVFEKYLDAIYSFNYSSTIERLYSHSNINFIHGRADKNSDKKIVLGISELQNQILIDNKAYGFVKYYQKLINNTDYQFLKPKSLITEIEERKVKNEGFEFWHPIEIYIWGHSLDSSDSDYVHEIFSFNNGIENSIRVIVYYYDKPHAQMANLISILGKDIVESWMKNEWLEFIQMPDIYKLNFDKDYSDGSVSEFSRSISEPIKKYKPIIMSY